MKNPKSAQWIASTFTKRWVSTSLKECEPNARSQQNTLKVLPQPGREWEGFGGCFNELGWMALQHLPKTAQQKILASLFGNRAGLRLTIGRIPMGASDYASEWYSCNEHDGDLAMKHFSLARDEKYLIPYIQAAQAFEPGLQFFASPWSPPSWMKHPRAYNYGTFIQEPGLLKAFATYFVKFVEGYAKRGIPISQVHPQNEPVADQKFPSCVWTGEELRGFLRDYLGPAMKKAHPDVEVWLGTLNTDDFDRMILPSLLDTKARAFLHGVGYQWAGRGAVQRTHDSFPELRLMQTENECGDGKNTWEYASYIFGLFQHYLRNGTTAYVYWNMILEPGGRSTWGWNQNSLVTIDPKTKAVVYQPEYTVMKHFSTFIRPGDRQLPVAGAWAGKSTAYANANGGVTVVMHNPLTETTNVTLEVEGKSFHAHLAPESFNTFLL